MARKKKAAAPEPELEIRADPELIEDPEVIGEELEPVKPERSHTELMMLRGLGLLPPGEDFIPTSLFVSNNVLTSGMGGDLEADIDASGIASFTIPGKAFTNIEEMVVDIVPVQEGSGDPSPDNVRPISGWSEAKIYVQQTVDPAGTPAAVIDLDGTRYGGTLDVTRGKLRVDRVMYALNGTENWIKSSSYRGSFYLAWGNIPSGSGISYGAFICSHAGYVPNLSEYAYGKCASDTALNLWVMQDPDATVNDFNAFLAEQYANGTPVTVCYTLATPIEVDLTPVKITAILGDNYIWADCGPVTKLEYSYDLLINQY